MSREVFINDHLEGVYASVRADLEMAEAALEAAKLRALVVDLIEAGGNVLHSTFVSGGEPKWRHTGERESFIRLSDALKAAFQKITGESV